MRIFYHKDERVKFCFVRVTMYTDTTLIEIYPFHTGQKNPLTLANILTFTFNVNVYKWHSLLHRWCLSAPALPRHTMPRCDMRCSWGCRLILFPSAGLEEWSLKSNHCYIVSYFHVTTQALSASRSILHMCIHHERWERRENVSLLSSFHHQLNLDSKYYWFWLFKPSSTVFSM